MIKSLIQRTVRVAQTIRLLASLHQRLTLRMLRERLPGRQVIQALRQLMILAF